MRSPPDLHMMACPPKFRSMGDFHQYYSGSKRAPYTTIVIGGNHESSGFLWECYHGGWLAPNIYFLGFAGCLLVDGWLRIAGASGIWKQHDFTKGHFETVPYDNSTIRSVYHIRQYDVARLLQLRSQGDRIDIFMSHDWPLGIEQHGDTAGLLRAKPFFKQEVEENRLGSPPLHAILSNLQPKFWFSAHLHVKFAALFHHDGKKTKLNLVRHRQGIDQERKQIERASGNPDEIRLDSDDEEQQAGGPDNSERQANEPVATNDNPDEIAMDDDDDEIETRQIETNQVESEEKGCTDCGGGNITMQMNDQNTANHQTVPDNADASSVITDASTLISSLTTKFLALSKPGFGKDFVQIVDIPRRQSDASSAPTTDVTTKATTETTKTTTNQSDNVDETSTSTDASTVQTPAQRRQPVLFFDPHWLAIIRAYSPYLSLEVRPTKPFPPVSEHEQLVETNLNWVRKNIGNNGLIQIDTVQSFVTTAPTMQHGIGPNVMPSWYTNPQTESICKLLNIENQINPMPKEFQLFQQQELERVKKEALNMLVDDVDDDSQAHQVNDVDRTGVIQAGASDETQQKTVIDEEPKGETTNPDELVIDDDED
ncbi:lariat debranching enzyme [Microbotryomycetes sp. JL221]|nr:lariat debranching enzyme [Microbotryomycetes sp. JL221]